TFPSPQQPATNPSLDQTPKALDAERLVEIGKLKLLPPGSDAFLVVDRGLVLVGRQKYVRRVLDDDGRFALRAMDKRMREICGGERLMLGLPAGDPDRELRMRLWREAAVLQARNPRNPSPAQVAQKAMQKVLARHAPKGSLDVVINVSLTVPSALAQFYFGVPGPDWVSPTGVAFKFAKQEIAQVPRDWLAALPPPQPQDVPYATLQFWAQTAFAHVFTNVVNTADLRGWAQRGTAEFFRHLDSLIDQAKIRPDPSTLLGCLMSFNPADYGLQPDRYAVVVRLLLAELIVGSSGTLSQALPNFIDYFCQHPGKIDPARRYTDMELDAIVREALRFQPVAPIVFRQCTQDALMGGKVIPNNSNIAVLLKTAMFDSRKFPNPGDFSTDPADRAPDAYLVFGSGLHQCKGADIGTVVQREMVRALFTLKDLHAAAGPEASRRDQLSRWSKYFVRFKPAG
ncbi:MAG TPA: cytochrome P450, partial [Reyranella sp.]|nr:cytochrome P450 [Reyranella sp.]